MKKLTNPVFLQTTHYQLSEEDTELLKLEALEIKESVSPASRSLGVRFNAIHAGTTRNKHTFPLEELEKSAAKWTKPFGKPILKNHDTKEEALGRIKEATVLRFSDTDGVLQIAARISDQDAIDKIIDERYLTVSVGMMSSRVECSICGVNWFEEECDHTVGRKYIADGSNTEKECTAVIRDHEPIELSFVNSPADANDERYAGVIHIGESLELEFYADESEGVIPKGKKKKSELPDNIALALKESYEEFLSQLTTEGEELSQMDEETEVQTDSTDETQNDVIEDVLDIATEPNESTEDVSTDPVEDNLSEDDIHALENYLAPQTEEAITDSESDEVEVVEDESDTTTQITELQNRVQELEAEKAELISAQAKQQDAVAEWVKVARTILSRHIVDLKVVLTKAETTDLEELEALTAASTLKTLSEELNTLRKEFKSFDFGMDQRFSQNGILDKVILTSDTTGTQGSTGSEEITQKSFSEDELISGFTSLFSRKRTL